MTLAQKREGVPLRVWPGVVAVVLLWLIRFGMPVVLPESIQYAMLGELAGTAAVLVWWMFFSRAPWGERVGAIALMAGAWFATRLILDPSVAKGMMGMMFLIFSLPVLSLALITGALAGRRMDAGPRRLTLTVAILVGCGLWACLRTGGINSAANSQFAWRWSKTPEQKLLDGAGVATSAPAAARATLAAPGTWPGFRGPQRDSRVTGVRIKTDWHSTPPVELWRRPVGPGWSSFAVGDGLLYTQEQRGEFEAVTCYNAATGEPAWIHRDATRFWESNAGAGPRGTPTLHSGRVYTLGATGILNALDARTGAVVWNRNVASDTGVKVPEWGFSSSPLVIDDLVIVAASGRLAAYDRASGNPRWRGEDGGGSYSSPHLLTIGGVAQVLLMSDAGATSVAPADGKVLWKHSWKGFSMLQPAMTADGGVLITTAAPAGGLGARRLAVAQGSGGWTAKEVWSSSGLKPYFNDLVIHDGYAYGFDGVVLSCIDLRDGKRMWKGGRYGAGQMLLLADQGLLLVVSEEGELALVAAAPGQFTEIARFPAMSDKTWNHPVVAGDLLLVRNGREMVAFRLPLAGA